jgi:peroxiredoxin
MLIEVPPDVGSAAPNFTLPSTAGRDVTLSAFRGTGNVVLAFFPLAFTSVCTAEMCDFTEDVSAFEGLDATVLGISVDSIPTLKAFQAANEIRVDLLSDFKRDVSRRYGTLLPEAFLSSRAYFIVDKQGVVRWRHLEQELGHKRDNAEVLAELEKLG